MRIRTILGGRLLIVAGLLWAAAVSFAQTAGAPGGLISGTITADRDYAISEASGNHIPAVQAVRVRARDIARHITYTVFSNKGRYQIFNLPPGSYEMSALKDSFESTTPHVDLKAGETKTVDVAMKAQEDAPRKELVDFDTLFPPGPTRDILMNECAGCHGLEHIPWQRMGGRDEDTWRNAVHRMFDLKGTNGNSNVPQVNPDGVPVEKREAIIKYFAQIFPPGKKQRDLKLDDLTLDEDTLSKAIFVEYDLPPPLPGKTPENVTSHDVFPSKISPMVWVAEIGMDVIQGMDTTKLEYPGRFKTYPLPNPDLGVRGLGPHGIAEAKDGHVYTAEIGDSLIGELDPETGQVHQYPTPTRSTPHTIRADSKGNLWFTEMQGASKIGRLDAKTKKITEYDPAPTYKNAHYYGMTVDQQDRVWAVGMTAHIVVGYDPRTDKWSTYPTPTQPAGPRRPTVDSKGQIWFSEHIGQGIGVLDPATGKITEYKNPARYAGEYECYADSQDNIWVTLRSYGAIAKFDQKTKQYTYYPLPAVDSMGREHPGLHGTGLGGGYPPKVEQDSQGTIWFAGLGLHVLTSFKPNGNVPNIQRASK
jgi:streptogramin lyase